ncbi:MAG: YdcF family protein [Actinobacteria bacterium]|nr:YdcF family protein [Actinomycetota bacterium]
MRRLLAVLVVLIGLWLVACAFLFVWPSANEKPPAHADAIVVLSGGRDSRLDPALKLMERGIAPVLAISSSGRDPKWVTARRLCNGTTKVSFKVVCFEAHPYSTRGEAETVTKLARTHDWTSLVVVSSTYHVFRAHMLFARCFHGKLWTVGTSSPTLRLPEEWASETAKLIVQTTFERGC